MRPIRGLCSFVLFSAWAASALAAPALSFTESRKTKPTCAGEDEACEYPLVGKFKLKATIDLPAGSGAPRFDADTPFELKFAGIDYEGTLGDDPRYRVGRKSCRLPIATVEDARGREKVVTVAALTWTSTRLTVTVSGKLPEEVVAFAYDGEETGDIADGLAACVHLGDALVRFDVAVSGKVTTVEREIRDGDGDVVDVAVLSTINVRGTGTPLQATDSSPSVTIASVPSSPTYNPRIQVQAYADEDLGVERMAYRLDGGPEVELSFSDGAKPGTGGEVDCEGARRATTSFEVDLGTEGQHTIEVFAYDASEQSGSATAQVEYRALRIEQLVGSLAVDSRGTVWMWDRSPPVEVPGIVVDRLFGSGHALDRDGALWKLGPAAQPWVRVTEFDAVAPIADVVASNGATLALTEGGEVWGFGGNPNGALGDGSLLSRTSAVRARDLAGAVRLGFVQYPWTVDDEGVLSMWGYSLDQANQPGNPGAGATSTSQRVPAGLPDMPRVRDFQNDGNQWIAAAEDGTALVGGLGKVAYPGDGRREFWDEATWRQFPTSNCYTPPVAATGLDDVDRVFLRGALRFAIAGEGRQLWIWGDAQTGELGDGSEPQWSSDDAKVTPFAVPGMDDVIDLRYEGGLVALRSDGSVWCWAIVHDRRQDLDLSGEPGTIPLVPVEVQGLPPIAALDADATTAWALGEDGTVWRWALNKRRYEPQQVVFVP